VTAGQTIYIEVVGQSAGNGTTNTNGNRSTNGSTDSVSSLPFLSISGGNTSTFQSVSQGPALDNTGVGASAALSSGNTTLTLRAIGSGFTADDTQLTLLTGTYQVGSTVSLSTTDELVSGQSTTTGSFKPSNATTAITATTEKSADPYLGFSPLTFSAAPLKWSGTNGGTWDINNTASFTANGNSTPAVKYMDGSAVTFGDTDAGGAAVTNTNPITITTGGVMPSSVSFTNTSLNTYQFTTAGSLGIAGNSTVSMSGNGTVIFASPNTYSGSTSITSGTLRANNGTSGSATGTSNITLSGGIFGGNGTITGNVTVNSGGAVTAGADATHAGTLNTGSQAWNSGGKYIWKINDLGSGGTGTAGSNWDLLTLSALTVPSSPASPFTVALESLGGSTPTLGTPAANFGNGVYKIASFTSTNIPGVTSGSQTPVILTGTNGVDNSIFQLDTTNFGNDTSGSSDGNLYLEYLGSGTGTAGSLDLVYNYAAAPEPGTGILLLAGLTPILLRRRRSSAVVT
jgi:autotransporter-associated beta strand protein